MLSQSSTFLVTLASSRPARSLHGGTQRVPVKSRTADSIRSDPRRPKRGRFFERYGFRGWIFGKQHLPLSEYDLPFSGRHRIDAKAGEREREREREREIGGRRV